MDYDIMIVGAGLYGCVYAHEACARGKRVLIIDRRSHIGGNCYTQNVRGIQVHKYGAHIFHTSDREVWDYVRRFSEFNHYINSPVAIYKDELYNLPFNMNTFSQMWGVKTPAEAQEMIERQRAEAEEYIRSIRTGHESLPPRGKVSPKETDEGRPPQGTDEVSTPAASPTPRNLEEQGLLLAGRDIFDKLIRGYTEKQWGRSCSELPAFIINRLPFRFVFDNNYFNDPYQGIPVDGYTALCARMLGFDKEEDIATGAVHMDEESGGRVEVRLQTALETLMVMSNGLPLRYDKGDDETPGYRTVTGDKVSRIVYTGRIDSFFDFRLGALEYRSLRFEEEDLPDVDNYQGNAVVNYTEREIPYTRVIEHKHFQFGKGEGSVITREYPDDYAEGKEPYYPLNDEKNNALYARYAHLAESEYPDILFGGRLGRYRYYNMDQVIRTALDDSRQ